MDDQVIAVVNDDTAFLDLMCELLTEEGYKTLAWRESDTAYEMVKRERPSLVILDVRMNNAEAGWQVLELIRLDPATADIPVIVCSADTAYLQLKAESLRRLKCDVLEKPFDLDTLLEKVRANLGPAPASS